MPTSALIQGLLAKIQPTPGTDAAPVVGTDAVRFRKDNSWNMITWDYNWENLRTDVVAGVITPPKPAIPRGRYAKIDIAWEVKGAGSDVPPEVDCLYRACGWAQTDGTQLFSYTQASTAHEMATIWVYAGGMLFKVTDCRGRWQWPLVVGEVAVHQFTMYGLIIVDPATTALPGGLVYDSNEPLAGVASVLSIGGAFSPDWLSGQFDPIGADPSMLVSGNAADGIKEFDYGIVDPSFQLTFRNPANLATYDPYGDLKARTSRALLMTYGTVQFNRVKLLSTTICPRKVQHDVSEGFSNLNVQYFVEASTLQYD